MSPSILQRGSFRALRVLLTGVTGFVGGALAVELLARGHRLTAVLRAPTTDEGRARVARSLARFVGQEGAPLAATVDVVLGDLADEQTYDDPRFDDATHIVHAAACTSFASKREVWRSNVVASKRLAERASASPNLVRFLFVGSAFCCGDRPNAIVVEDDAPRAHHDYVNEYSRTKAAAELALLEMGERFPLLVARPSVVVGHTTLGVSPSSSLFWYYRALAALRAGPSSLAAHRDVVSVDYVAKALAFLIELERPRYQTYHVSSGRQGAVPLGEVLSQLGPLDGWRVLSPSELAEMSRDLLPWCDGQAQASAVARGVAACSAFGALGVEWFDATRLSHEGFPPSPPFTSHLQRCIETSAGRSLFELMVDET